MQKGNRMQFAPKTTRERSVEKKTAKKKATPVGLLVIALMTVLTVVFAIILAVARLLPAKFLLLIYVVLLLALAVIALLVKDQRKHKRFAVGLVISAVMTLVLVIGGLTLGRGIRALNTITGGETEINYVGVYVQIDDAAQELEDTAQYTYGILEIVDQQVTEKALEKLNKELKTEIKSKEFDSITDQMDALLEDEVDVILLPEAYIPLLSEMPGYQDVPSKIRALTILELKSENKEPAKKPKNPNSFAVLISGIDTYGYVNAVSRSDVNILAVVNTDTKQVLLLSTPRDYYVPLSISNGVKDKLTHAGIYGVEVSMDTIGMIYDMDVDYFFRVNFSGFREIIDSLGGVTVYSEYEFATAGGYYFGVGENYMDGDKALAFARERKSFEEGDRQRGRNQMAVIEAVLKKMLSPELLKNFSGVMDAVEGNFQTSVPYDKIASLVREQLDEGGNWNIVTYSVSGTEDTQNTYSMPQPLYVVIPNEATIDTAKELIRQVYEDETITKP